ncbi:hypothetical protein [Paenibacillus illinoisensis]|uniref:Uncharacterized protein n=1 Tax=Paenibacillus illinoisensis TaxID=59845 RepID=A0A2W0C1T9_9BACL|nr:hypothetical protein [Paenibacillus illinoisensis]PYY25644.1 hypothetical protein PIL02S_06482 [Paenibacillus illinoisensis]
MKSKRAMIDRRNAERRVRREQKRNPPGPFFKLFDWIWKMVYVLFLLSLAVVAICHWFLDTGPGPRGTNLIPFTAERIATLMLFIMLATACVVGIRAMIKSKDKSSKRAYKQPDGKRLLIMKIIFFLFFALIIAISAIICWTQLKALADVWKLYLSWS